MILTTTLNPAFDALLYVPHLQWRAKNIISTRRTYVAGKGFNVARALAALGLETTALGLIGRADIGTFARSLEPRGVRLIAIPIASTRTNLKVVELETGFETELNEPGASVDAGRLDEFRQEFRRQLDAAEWVVMSGSVAPGITPNIYAELIDQARERRVRTLLDTSGELLRLGAPAHPTVLRINRAELVELAGMELESEQAAADAASSLLIGGTSLVVVSLGHKGALLANADGRWLARPPELRAVNALGAGDVMSAGIIDGCRRKLPGHEMLRWATALASASVLTEETGHVELATAREVQLKTIVSSL